MKKLILTFIFCNIKVYAKSVEELGLNCFQIIGTHNSYKRRTHSNLYKIFRKIKKQQAQSIDYEHLPIKEQLSRLNIRKFEFDIYADPQGKRYYFRKLLPLIGKNPFANKTLKNPGFKVLHSPDLDFNSTCLTLKQCLQKLNFWSKKNPQHFPIYILLEYKHTKIDSFYKFLVKSPIPASYQLVNTIDQEILSIIPKEKIIYPDLVRGKYSSLKEAIKNKGWPKLKNSRGKFIFLLDNIDKVKNLYLQNHNKLENRLLFVSSNSQSDNAAFIKENNPISNFYLIKKLVKKGYLIRTRADYDTIHARENDHSQKKIAFSSGAQLISTDYPEPDHSLSNYQVSFSQKGDKIRINPLTKHLSECQTK
jgi:hypothetical protein